MRLHSSIAKLTNRQLEVLALIGKEKSNKEIMNELFIEQSTLKTHINNIYKILELNNRKQARELAKSMKS